MNTLKSLAGVGRWASAAALVMAVLSGCGGSSSNDTPSSSNNTPPVIAVMVSGMVDPGTAGADVSASAGSVLTVSASGSTDADGDVLSYKWTLVSKPVTSNLALTGDTQALVSVKPDVAGTYVLSLRLTDSKGAYAEKKATVLIRDNAAPVTSVAVSVAFTGQSSTKPTQDLNIGASVVLDASNSTDAEGDVVTTGWTLLEKPAGSVAELTSENATTRFVADLAGVYKVRARGTDPLGASSDAIYVFDAKNHAPAMLVLATVNTAEMTVAAGYTVSLNSQWTYDPTSNTAITYAWSLVKPDGSTTQLSSASDSTTQVYLDRLGKFVVKLVITNANGVSSTYTTNITVNNWRPLTAITSATSPTALPTGPAIHLPANSLITLRGTNSVDADGDVLTYSWTMASKPAGSAAAFATPAAVTTQLTVDLAGSYDVVLRVSDPSGAYSEQALRLDVGNYAPVAVIDRGRITVLAGSLASASAALSFDEDRDTLSYAWAVDARPAGSSATIAAPSASTLSFTPDVAGTYVVSVTVSDGISSNVSYVTINALASFAATVSLPFAPLETRYSRGLDKLVIAATNPNTIKIVDPFTGLIKTVMLPAGTISMTLSPDGKLAAVLHDGIVSLVDLETAALLHSTAIAGNPSEAFVSNAGNLYLYGTTTGNYDNQTTVLNGRTGANLTASLGAAGGSYYNLRGVFAGTKGRTLAVNATQSSSSIYTMDIDAATGKILRTGNSPYSNSSVGTQVFLSENEDLLFTNAGNYFRTDTLAYAGKLVYTGNLTSLSHSSAAEETVLLTSTPGGWPDYGTTYAASYKRYVGALFLADSDLMLPIIGGAQSYGVNIFHSASGKHVALVQTGSNAKFGAGVSYHVITR